MKIVLISGTGISSSTTLRMEVTMALAKALGIVMVAFLLGGCQKLPSSPSSPDGRGAAAKTGASWGPETPNFNLEVILRGDGFGHVKFRQPNDDAQIVYLDTWVRDLAPNTSYLLQRAVDTTPDDVCTSSAWLTLGKGLVPQSITTDDTGTGREELFRNLTAFPVGSEFDIHFRVIHEQTSAVVLTSDCYQFTISQ